MKVVDPGHCFRLEQMDATAINPPCYIHFVKRRGEKYPGNDASRPGPLSQEYIRALISRTQYVNEQIPCWYNRVVIRLLRICIYLFERRAFQRHGDRLPVWMIWSDIEQAKTCGVCGHILGHTWHYD